MKILVAVAAAVMLMIGVLACGSGSPSPLSSSAPASSPPTSSAGTSSTSSPPANPGLVATFSDGTQVLVTGGSSSGNNIWQQALEIIAGPAGFSGLANLQVQPVDSNPGDAWTGGGVMFYHGFAGNSTVTNEPALPSNATNETVQPPAVLAPGASICVEENFENNGSASSADTTEYISGWKVTATLGDGSTDTVSLPFEGSSGVPACLFD